MKIYKIDYCDRKGNVLFNRLFSSKKKALKVFEKYEAFNVNSKEPITQENWKHANDTTDVELYHNITIFGVMNVYDNELKYLVLSDETLY